MGFSRTWHHQPLPPTASELAECAEKNGSRSLFVKDRCTFIIIMGRDATSAREAFRGVTRNKLDNPRSGPSVSLFLSLPIANALLDTVLSTMSTKVLSKKAAVFAVRQLSEEKHAHHRSLLSP
ncbi:unnamed protein product [Ectocarpus sp. 6 AP-2014]